MVKQLWKEKDFSRPYYKLHTASKEFDSNFHGIPIAREMRRVEIPAEYLEEISLPPPSARVIVSFENKLCGDAADNWVSTCARQLGFQMEITKSANTGFHVLEIFGRDAEADVEKLLKKSPVEVDGIYAAFTELKDDSDLDFPVGFNQLIWVKNQC
jgi:hypothetical protein